MLLKCSKLLLVLLITLPFAAHAQMAESKATQETKPQQSPPSLPPNILEAELKSAKGVRFNISNYQGNVLVLTLWATWCLPCHFQTPALVRLQNEFRAKGVRVVELSTEDPTASAREVRQWIRYHKVNYRVGWAPEEFASTLTQGNNALPQMFVIGRDGHILKRFIGYSKERTEGVMKETIEQALKEP